MNHTHTLTTKEEITIVKALADGAKANRLAHRLGIEEAKLAVKLSEMRIKYDCENSTHLVAYFLRNKLID